MALDIGQVERPPRDLVAAVGRLSTPTIVESLKGRFNMSSEIKPLWQAARLAGVAITVRCHVGDNLTLHKAIELCAPGDVIVVDAGGYKEAGGMWGEIMALAARKRGIEGVVIDGAARDVAALRSLGFPVFARTSSPGPTTKRSFGCINRPITCGGVLVCPGDVVVGDEDGVVVIPRARAGEVLEMGRQREAREARVRELIEEGKTTVEIFGFDRVLEQL